jgi:hypothetical protein
LHRSLITRPLVPAVVAELVVLGVVLHADHLLTLASQIDVTRRAANAEVGGRQSWTAISRYGFKHGI